jgi:pyridoxal phosphate enzyme (YggS family)
MEQLIESPSVAIARALALIRGRIDAACSQAGRPSRDVTLVAVSKTHGVEAVRAASACGQIDFGENRVQEATAKFTPLRDSLPALRLHLIGGLQTNKAGQAVQIADVIESLDREDLAVALARAAEKTGRLPQLLVQVNTGQEPQKSGIALTDAPAFITRCQGLFGSRLCGLMCIPPLAQDPTPHFHLLAGLARAHGLAVLSMGMSGDFEAAIEAGATHVRIGSAIFGARTAPAGHAEGGLPSGAQTPNVM